MSLSYFPRAGSTPQRQSRGRVIVPASDKVPPAPYQVYDGATGAVTNGQGKVEEMYRTVVNTPTGRQVQDIGSRVGISAGEFYPWWSEGGAGARS